MNRRGFLTGLVGVVAAPAIVRSESLMKLWVPPQEIDLVALHIQARLEAMRYAVSQTWKDAALYGTGAVQTYQENGLIRFRRVSPFELFPEADNQLAVQNVRP